MSAIIVSMWLLWMSALDIRSRSVPAWLIGLGGAVALAVSLVESFSEIAEQGTWWNYVGTMLCGIIPGGCLLMLALVTKTVGSGDGAVVTLLGMVLGFRKSIFVLCIGLFLAALGSTVLLVIGKVKRNTCLPFLPFLTMGWFLVGMK